MPDRLLNRAYRLARQVRAGARRQRIEAANGEIWPVWLAPPQSVGRDSTPGVPVVLFHGFGNDGSTWLPFFPALREMREVLAPDLPGFGAHALGEGVVASPRWYRGQSAHLLRALTVRWGQPPIVIGKSMGAMVAGLVAGELPDLVRALVLIDPAGIETPRVSPFWKEWQAGNNLLLPSGDDGWDAMIAMLYHRPPRVPGFVRRNAMRQLATRRPVLQKIFDELLIDGFNPLGERLSRITCPVTVLWGAHDRVMDPSGIEVVSRELPGAAVHVFPDCGHSPAREAPAKTLEIISHVLSRWG